MSMIVSGFYCNKLLVLLCASELTGICVDVPKKMPNSINYQKIQLYLRSLRVVFKESA